MNNGSNRDSLGQRAARGLIWSAAGTYGTQVVQLGILAVLTRLVEPEQFGLVAYAMVFIAVADIFVNFGFAEALIQRTKLEEGHLDSGFWLQLGFGTALAGALFAGAPLIGSLLQEARLTSVLRALSPYFVLSALSKVPAAILARALRFREIVAREVVGALCGGVVAIVLAFRGFTAGALVAQLLVTAGVGAGLLWLISAYRPRLRFSRKHARDLISFGTPVIGLGITNFMNVRFQDFVVGYWLGPTALGYFTIAMRVLWLINRGFGGVANAVALPAFSRMEGDLNRLSAAVLRVARILVVITAPLFAGISLLSEPTTRMIFGESWLPAAPLMAVIMLIGPLQCVLMPAEQAVIASGRPMSVFLTKVLFSAMGVVLLFLALPWGTVAVAAAYLLRGYVVLLPLYLRLLRTALGMSSVSFLGILGKPILATGIMATAVWITRSVVESRAADATVILVSAAVGGVVYSIALGVMDPRGSREVLRELRNLAASRPLLRS